MGQLISMGLRSNLVKTVKTGGLLYFEFFFDLLCIFATISLCKLFVEKPAKAINYYWAT